jgi:thiaminase/transcriptional activator TenA
MVEQDPADSRFVRTAGDLWTLATRSPFLDAAADGTLPATTFAGWLVQDYHFALGLTAFEGVLVARSPRPAQSVIIQGLGAMDAELAWFEAHAAARGLVLGVPLDPACRRYVDFLLRGAHEESLPGLYAALYGVEVSYLTAWSARRPEGPYAEFIARWSSGPFRDFVLRLKALAEEAPDASAQGLFDEVLRHERAFWAMVWAG